LIPSQVARTAVLAPAALHHILGFHTSITPATQYCHLQICMLEEACRYRSLCKEAEHPKQPWMTISALELVDAFDKDCESPFGEPVDARVVW